MKLDSLSKGKRMLVRLKCGQRFIDTCVDTTRIFIVFSKRRVRREDIKSMSIYRETVYTWLSPSRHGGFDSHAARENPNSCPWMDETCGPVKNLILCGQELDSKGSCPEHGHVRHGQYDKKDEKRKPGLVYHKTPKARGYLRSRKARYEVHRK